MHNGPQRLLQRRGPLLYPGGGSGAYEARRRRYSGLMTEQEARFFVTFLTIDRSEEWADEYYRLPPMPGQLVLGTPDGGKAHRITEVWHNGDKHGAVVHGIVAIVEPVDMSTTELYKVAPDYYA